MSTASQAIPTNFVPVIKAGLDFTNPTTKFKLLANLRTFVLEHNLTYLARSNFVVGYNLVLDSRVSNLEKYDFGFSWEPVASCFVGLKHESTNKGKLELGKFFLYFH